MCVRLNSHPQPNRKAYNIPILKIPIHEGEMTYAQFEDLRRSPPTDSEDHPPRVLTVIVLRAPGATCKNQGAKGCV